MASDKAAYKSKNEIQEIKFFANDGSYSISAQPRDIKEYELVYISDEYIYVGDEFVLSFYDDKDMLIKIPLKAEHNNDWIEGYPKAKKVKK